MHIFTASSLGLSQLFFLFLLAFLKSWEELRDEANGMHKISEPKMAELTLTINT